MTRFTISLAATALTISLVPPAQAYGTEPSPEEALDSVELVNVLYGAQSTKVHGVCQTAISPILAELLGLTPQPDRQSAIALACVAE